MANSAENAILSAPKKPSINPVSPLRLTQSARRENNNQAQVGTLRCGVPPRVQRAGRMLERRANHTRPCAAERGADGAAHRPHQHLGLVLICLTALCLCGCATSYHPAKAGGKGFADAQISSNEFWVSFNGNSQTGIERAYDFALLHSSEVVQQHGCPYFAVMDVTNTSSAKAYTANQRYYVDNLFDGELGPPALSGYNSFQRGAIVEVSEPRIYFQPGTVLKIKCFPAKPVKPFTYDAAALQQTLKQKYKLR